MKLYVRNLESDATEHSIRALFEPYGSVESVRINKHRLASRSFAFVEMKDSAAAVDAIEALHQSARGERVLHVMEARSTRVISASGSPPDERIVEQQ